MAMTVEYLHVCDYAFIGENGKPGTIGIFDRIGSQAFPTAHPFMAIAVQLRGTAHEVSPIKMEVGRPNGNVLVSMEAQVTVNEAGGAFMVFNLINTQFPEAGRYVVKILAAGQTLTSQSLHLVKNQPGLQSAPPGSDPKKFH